MDGLDKILGIKDFEALVTDTLQSIVDADVGITNINNGSVVRTIVESILDNVDMTNYYAQYIYSAMCIDTSTGNNLDRLVSVLGIVRNASTYASDHVTFSTGDTPYQYDIIIPYGTIISTRKNNDGSVIEFSVIDEDAILTAGETSLDVLVQCVDAGHKYLPAGALCILSSSIIGIQSVINTSAINSGSDQETDDELRSRTKETLKSYGKCTFNALKTEVEKIDGVENCSVIDIYNGIVGTAAVIVATNIMPPTQELINEIETTVELTKACGIKVDIIYPTIEYVDISINIDNTVDMDDMLEAISNYIYSLNVGQALIVRQMERKILNALDDTNNVNNDMLDITTLSPANNVSVGQSGIIRANSITINGVAYDV